MLEGAGRDGEGAGRQCDGAAGLSLLPHFSAGGGDMVSPWAGSALPFPTVSRRGLTRPHSPRR